MKILLTGGTGLIGRHLITRLLELGHQLTVSTRNPERAKARLDPRVTLWRGFEGQNNLDGFDAVINLAGEPIADKRWTAEQKSACATAAGTSPGNWSRYLKPAKHHPPC